MTQPTVRKCLISAAALALAFLHLIRPELKIDAITVALFAVSSLPWIWSILKSAEIPFVGKVEFRELETAGKLIEQQEIPIDAVPLNNNASYLAIADQDPALALVGLRIEVERRLRNLAIKSGLRGDGSLHSLVKSLESEGALPVPSAKGISAIVDAGNRAAHGAQVDVALHVNLDKKLEPRKETLTA